MAQKNDSLTPDQIRDDTRRSEEQRMECVRIAQQRAKPDDTAQDIATAAAALFNFVKGTAAAS